LELNKFFCKIEKTVAAEGLVESIKILSTISRSINITVVGKPHPTLLLGSPAPGLGGRNPAALRARGIVFVVRHGAARRGCYGVASLRPQ
jgi:hypothetical protein